MTASTPADDRTDESVDMVTEPEGDDPADMAGNAAEATADQMHGESDEIADSAAADTEGRHSTG